MQLVLQATVCDCLALDPFAFEEDGLGASKIDVSRGEIGEALVMALSDKIGTDAPRYAFGVTGICK